MTAKAVADIQQSVVLARVDIKAPPERVFKALTTDELTKWWGAPGMYQTTSFSIDLRPGGKWRTSGKSANGDFHVEGEVLEVDPPRRLVQTWRPSWEPEEVTRIVYSLDAIEGGTRVTVRHSGFKNPQSCDDHATGWERVLGWLSGHLAAANQYFFVRLVPPRPTFAMDMSATERAAMMEHGMYWRGKLAEGFVLAFGPVMDPKGPWGLGLLHAPDEAAIRAFEKDDPAVSKLGMHYEVLPFAQLVH